MRSKIVLQRGRQQLHVQREASVGIGTALELPLETRIMEDAREQQRRHDSGIGVERGEKARTAPALKLAKK
jgi:hypothetical protein